MIIKRFKALKWIRSVASLCILFFSGCGEKEAPTEDGLTPIVLQTDWYAQAEHGGFYQAVAEGYYKEAGLDVTINQGGPNALTYQKVASRNADFAIGRSDDIIIQAARGVPLLIAASFMQHDPQALLVHADSDVKTFKDLDGKKVMTTPGAVFVDVLRRQYDINIDIIPLDYGMSRFINDPEFIQQCFITNEPYYMAKEGVPTRTLLLAKSGFDPYRVIYTNKKLAKEKPEIVKAFIAASIKGWNSYLAGPRKKANAVIASLNPKMTEEFLAYSLQAMKENELITGRNGIEETGIIVDGRIQEQIDTLKRVGLLDTPLTVESIAPSAFRIPTKSPARD